MPKPKKSKIKNLSVTKLQEKISQVKERGEDKSLYFKHLTEVLARKNG